MPCTVCRAANSPRATTRVLGIDPRANRKGRRGQQQTTVGRTEWAGFARRVCHGRGRFSRRMAREARVIDWNVVVTVRQDFNRAIGLLRRFGKVERTGLFNVIVMRVTDVRALLDQLAEVPAEEHLFATISHVVPISL